MQECSRAPACLVQNVLQHIRVRTDTSRIAAQMIAVQHENSIFFAGLHQNVLVGSLLIGQHQNAARTLIQVCAGKLGLIEWCERIDGSEFYIRQIERDGAVAELIACIEWRLGGIGSIAGGHEHPPSGPTGIDRHAGACHPYSIAKSIRRSAHHRSLCKRRSVIGKDPSMPRPIVAMRAEPDVHISVVVIQRRTIVLPQRAE